MIDIVAEPTLKPFKVIEDGVVVYRTALSMAERTGKTTSEQETLVQEQYQAQLDAIAYTKDHPEESTPPEEG